MAIGALADVREMVDWLEHTEQRLGAIYAKAAQVWSDDTSFATFLRRLVEDERSHAEFMTQAAQHLHDQHHRPPLDILLDAQTRGQVEDLFTRFERLLNRAEVAKKDIIEYLARAEASELNPIFLYVAAEYRQSGREGERMTGEIQRHLLDIQAYINALPRHLRPSVDVATLPFVGEQRFLVVDDHVPLRRLVASLLSGRGVVDTAAEGHEALERLREHFHDGIITDVQMPGMSGIEFYRQATAFDARLKQHFLFYSASMTPKDRQYLRRHNLPFLRKPFGLEQFHTAMNTLLSPKTGRQKSPSD